MASLRRELENNTVLKNDLGPFEEVSDEWGALTLVFKESGARIMVGSVEQSIRGLRHNQHRPDLIICDDVENLDSVKTRESRDKTYDWLMGEVIPARGENARIVVVGNMLHEDSLMARLKQDVSEGKRNAAYREYPLLDENGAIAWPGKYPTMAHIETERQNMEESAFSREFLLKIISDADRVIHPEWIQYYDELPQDDAHYRKTYLSVDPAISDKESADFTAMVGARLYGYYQNIVVYILPNPVNERLTFPQTFDRIRQEAYTIGHRHPARIVIEDVAYQQALIQQFQHMGNLHVEGFKPWGDKRARLALTSKMIQNGQILFPRKGAELLIGQLIGFGKEKHDDLADAFSMLILMIIENNSAPRAQIFAL